MAQRRHKRQGFTLIDVLGAIVIVGTAIAATMNWMASGTMANAQTGRMSVAVVLANNVHEYALTLDPGKPDGALPTAATRTLVLHLDGGIFAVPITSQGVPLAAADMPGWSLSTAVTSCRVDDLNPEPENAVTFATTTATDLRRLTVTVSYQTKAIYSAVWLLSHSTDPTSLH